MIRYILLFVVLSCTNARIHDLNLKDDDRKTITLSTFGFLTGGTLAVNVTLSDLPQKIQANGTLFGFTLDKTKSPGLAGYMEDMQKNCILNDNNKEDKDKANDVESVYIRFDLNILKVTFDRVGKGLQKLLISSKDQKTFQSDRGLHRRNAHADLSSDYAVGLQRSARDAKAQTPVMNKLSDTPSAQSGTAGTLDGIKTGAVTASSGPVSTGTKDDAGTSPASSDETNSVTSNATNKGRGEEASAETLLNSVVVSRGEGGVYQAYFLVYIQRPEEEGLYNLYFHNCLAYYSDNSALSLLLKIVEDNNGNYLTAGEMPVPALYFTFCVLFFICGVAWFSVIRKSNEDVFKIHYLMLVVIFVKSLACLFHGVNMYFIQINGVHEEAWAVLWYIVYLTRGALMFVTVLLIGAGWAFIKHMLTDKEKKLFLIVIPLQVLDQVAWVIVEESEEGNQSYTTWNEIFILVDLLCCGAILFPVVWSIRHLQDASGTDGKAAINLQKLRLFRHFYILVVCYIYFTRIIVYLMKITLPFKLEWLTDLFTELAMMVFFIVTGIKFRPATDNPYLQVPLDSDDEDIEMEEVLTKTGNTENLVKVNQKTEGADNSRVKQRESSHESQIVDFKSQGRSVRFENTDEHAEI